VKIEKQLLRRQVCAAVFVLQHPEMTKVALGKCVKAEKHKKFLAIKITLMEDFHKPILGQELFNFWI